MLILKKSNQLAEWENRTGDELITLGTSYKRFNVRNWTDYLKAKSRQRSIAHGRVR